MDLEVDLEGDCVGDSKGDIRGEIKQHLEVNFFVKLMSCKVQVESDPCHFQLQTGLGRGFVVKLRSRLGLVQVCFRFQIKFNSL